MIHNHMETLVSELLKNELQSNPSKYVNLCKCEDCMARIETVALNNLDPFYVTCVSGEVYGSYHARDVQNLSMILVAIGKGVSSLDGTPIHQT